MANEFSNDSFSKKPKINLSVVAKFILLLSGVVPLSYIAAINGFTPLLVVMIGLIGGVVAVVIFKKPKVAIYLSMLVAIFIPSLNRFVYAMPYGFIVEIILLFVYVVLFFKHFKKLDFSEVKNPVVIMMLIWFAYVILQIANPNAQSLLAWLYAMRGIALFQVLLIPLVFLILDSEKDLKQFLIFYISISLLAVFWGAKQQTLGLTEAERDYLYSSGAYVTHILFGKLRVFSFYFDAGTYGAAMGHLCIISALLYLGPFNRKQKLFFLIVTLATFYALMISGTRGALAVPATGALVYVILIKNIKYIALTGGILLISFMFLKHSSIGNSNYNINRLRTALDPEDASLNVRIENRKRLTAYLSDKPFGGGVGSAGSWGQRFTPNTWLANFPPDGLYTRIRAETGRVGHTLYLGIWLYILFLGFRACWNMKNDRYKSIATAFLAGYAGILVANYGNEVMTQYPNNFVTYITISYVFIIRKWDLNKFENESNSLTKTTRME